MSIVKRLSIVFAFSVVPLTSFAQQQAATINQVVDETVRQEHAEMELLRHYSPLVETYIQDVRPDKNLGTVPDGDKYFLGRAQLAKGAVIEPLIAPTGFMQRRLPALHSFISEEFNFDPRGFLQMIYVDTGDFDRQHYSFDYVGRVFLGDVRCFVFDIEPLQGAGRGRFVGRIWVEDHDYHIVRFNGTYSGSSRLMGYYFNFDSWRTRADNGQWLPTAIYSAEGDVERGRTRGTSLKAVKAQTRLWGYSLNQSSLREQELATIRVDGETPIDDQAESINDYSAVQAERSWNRQAEDNVTGKLERLGLLASYGDVDKILETVVNNLEVTSDLDIQPEVRCRVLMTSTFESFTVGHTIVLSRGLIDVIPDEATLAAILAHELGHMLLGNGDQVDSEFAFFGLLRFNERDVFHHFDFAHTPDEEQAANQKGKELLQKSPYKDDLENAQLFLRALQSRSKDIPALVSPHLGDKVSTDWQLSSPASSQQNVPEKHVANIITALPLGGRIKVEPWTDHLEMMKTKPASSVAEHEKRPFEVTPLFIYLTRGDEVSPRRPVGAVAAKSDAEAIEPDLGTK